MLPGLAAMTGGCAGALAIAAAGLIVFGAWYAIARNAKTSRTAAETPEKNYGIQPPQSNRSTIRGWLMSAVFAPCAKATAAAVYPPTPSNHWRKPEDRKGGSTLRSQTRKPFGEEGLASADFAEEIKRYHERELVELHFPILFGYLNLTINGTAVYPKCRSYVPWFLGHFFLVRSFLFSRNYENSLNSP